MSLQIYRIAGCSLLLIPMVIGTSEAGTPPQYLPVAASHPAPAYNPGIAAPAYQQGYPYLNAPMYPSPTPNTPVQVGRTSMITNQAFYPQEMLYPHDYSAMYPPFYYKSTGKWFLTPWGVHTDEAWKLQGTRVTVKYRSHIPFWTGFTKPHRQYFLYDQNWSNSPPMSRRNR
ncbi:hypothetical protein [Calycomorphotria hydatis]|uniref:Uncharacterized protein n=1 Tax=Calycomorphotria hydatis TaxID=2528027 RepID=A0A517TCG6_9PLAN|nr:hypothetical protein [Calycomorphotria hydatis]QDT66067.1 hypothetical protein V22_33310 [Calycomorphotria hydatis]